MVVMVTVSNLDSRLAVDVKVLESLLHDGVRGVIPKRAGGKMTCKIEGGPVTQSLLVASSWYPSRCRLIYIKLLVHERSE
jgi:hypothetical protein